MKHETQNRKNCMIHASRFRLHEAKGFTLIEILIGLVIFSLLLTASLVTIGALRGSSDLQADARGLQRALELARNRTMASQGDTRYGVYIDTGTSPHQYVVFQGVAPLYDYASRAVSADEVYEVRDAIEFAAVSFGGGPEVVFDRIQGTTSQAGNAQLRVKADPADIKTVYVQSAGAVEIDNSSVPTDDDRVKDSRHAHVDYNGRTIDTATEIITLDFAPSPTTYNIPIADNLSGGQIMWEDTITVDGEDQKLKIHTHQLNGGVGFDETTFSVHRDRRFNTKALSMELSGAVGTVISYDASGNTTPGTSVYASSPNLQ